MSVLSSKSAVVVGVVALLTGCSAPTLTNNVSPTPTPLATSSSLPEVSSSPVISNDQPREIEPMVTSSVVPGVSATPTIIEDQPMVAEQMVSPIYQNYTPELYASLKGKQAFVLFFHAAWCPTCKRMDQEITAALASFPSGTIILKTNYDTETALKRTWGVQVQSTVVVLDAKGDAVLKAVDPGIAKMKASITQSL